MELSKFDKIYILQSYLNNTNNKHTQSRRLGLRQWHHFDQLIVINLFLSCFYNQTIKLIAVSIPENNYYVLRISHITQSRNQIISKF